MSGRNATLKARPPLTAGFVGRQCTPAANNSTGAVGAAVTIEAPLREARAMLGANPPGKAELRQKPGRANLGRGGRRPARRAKCSAHCQGPEGPLASILL
jgi:hypothetical protein